MSAAVIVFDAAAAEGHSCTAQFARPCTPIESAHTWLCGNCGEGLVYPTLDTLCSQCGAKVIQVTQPGGNT